MTKFIWIFLCVFVTCKLEAQPRTNNTQNRSTQNTNQSNANRSTWAVGIPAKDTTSKAKAQINAFWKQIEKMHNHDNESNKQVVFSSAIQSAKSALNNTKMKDPAYNTSLMEKALAECESVYNGLANAKEDSRVAQIETLKKFNLFFETVSRNLVTYDFVSGETDAEKLKRVKNNDDSIAKYKNLAIEFSKADKDPVIYADKLNFVIGVSKKFQTPYSDKDKWPVGLLAMKHIEDPSNAWSYGMFSFIQEVKRWEAYFYAAKVIFPNIPEIEKAHDYCLKAMLQIGSLDNILDRIKSDKAKYLSSVKMPEPKVTDVTLENQFKKLFNEMGYKETIVSVSIQSTDWTIDRNEWTGVILGRSKCAYIATKTADGLCYITEFWIFQDYNGSGYGEFRNVTSNSFRSQTDCKNIQ